MIDLEEIHLDKGKHSGPGKEVCLMEAVAWFAGESHSDHPACVSRVLGTIGRGLNDRMPDGPRQKLKELIPLLPGTADDGLDIKRAYMAADWAVRVAAPMALDARGLTEQAQKLRELSPIVDVSSAREARRAAAAAEPPPPPSRRLRLRRRRLRRSYLGIGDRAVQEDDQARVMVSRETGN